MRAARRLLQTAAASGWAAALALVALQAALAPGGALLPPLAPGRAGTLSAQLVLAALAAESALEGAEQRFVFVDYEHSGRQC